MSTRVTRTCAAPAPWASPSSPPPARPRPSPRFFYEVFGIITNGLGGWIASHLGLNRTMIGGSFLQVLALAMLAVDPAWLTVGYVMTAMALSGIAKDLNKMSAKSSVKLVVPKGEDANTRLFKWVAILTGSKNTLKGAGYFLGGLLLFLLDFQWAMGGMAVVLLLVYLWAWWLLPGDLGRAKVKAKISQIFSKTREINILSAIGRNPFRKNTIYAFQ